MDRGDVEPDRRMHGALAGVQQLLRHANGGALAGDGHDEIRRHHPQVRQPPCLDRPRQCRHDSRSTSTLAWKKPQRIFVNSMSDLSQTQADEAFIHQVGASWQQAPGIRSRCLPNVQNACLIFCRSRCFQRSRTSGLEHPSKARITCDRIDLLRRVPARIRFVSFEPLLGPITELDLRGIHWAIVGGESGPRARDDSRMVGRAIARCLPTAGRRVFLQAMGREKKEALGACVQGPYLG